jgi:hypothetical protein
MDISTSGVVEQKRITVFFSSAREDEKLLNELKKHLHPFQRQKLIEHWQDREIKAGSEWESEVKKERETAHILLRLVSLDFIASGRASA